MADLGIAVVSGLARGIDGMAHRGALEHGGYTLGVLGCGIDIVYPRENEELFREMNATGGIMSEYPPGMPPFSGFFRCAIGSSAASPTGSWSSRPGARAGH